jgi:hypothetical protein
MFGFSVPLATADKENEGRPKIANKKYSVQ